MGYYTRYSLKVENTKREKELIAELRGSNEEAHYAFDENGLTYESLKWYDNEDHMKAFSTRHPRALFILCCDGENRDDFQAKFFRNGKMYIDKAFIAWPEFDAKKLK
jgi:hypothetical protein